MNCNDGDVPAYGTKHIRVSKLALFSMISGVLLPLALALWVLILTAGSSPLDAILGIILLVGLVLAFCAGIVSAIRITISRGSLTGSPYAAVGILLPGMILGILLLYMLSVASHMGHAYRMTCGTNLAGIGKAMLIYANDYDDRFPQAGAETNLWSDSVGGHANPRAWLNRDRSTMFTFGEDGKPTGAVTASSSLYLLVRYAEVSPRTFICKSEDGAREFRLKDWLGRSQTGELTGIWDFGYFAGSKRNQTRHVSYGYHHPFGEHALTVYHEPGMAVSADRSPWLDPAVNRESRWAVFEPDIDPNTGSAEQARNGNSQAHEGQGQNVLFLDSHVAFEKRPFVGLENDNIYTIQDVDDPKQNPRGRLPVLYDATASAPRTRRDSVLLQENGSPSKKSEP